MTITDEMLFAAAEEAAERYLSALPDQMDCGHVFSKEFEEKMRPLLRRTRRKIWKRALLLAAVVITLAAGLYAGADRKPVYRVDWSQGDGYVTYAIRAEQEILAKPHPMAPDYVPDGYVLERRSAAERSCSVHYRNDGDGSLDIYQDAREKKTGAVLGDDFQAETITVNDGTGLLVEYGDGACILFWADGPNILELYSREISREDVLKIAESMRYEGGN